ncbi:tetratricopeptide repeat protein, partial [Sulfurovum sp. bin170]|uniref:tetratricopeptide repeat protein n=1 Tax=Sulfurovum sp. bin170 TaxID=2695268 RepID=UPI0013E059B3
MNSLCQRRDKKHIKTYKNIKKRCKKDEQCRAKRLIELLLGENANGKVAFIFDNLESVQNPTDKKVEDETIKIWIEVLDTFDDVVLLITSRWLVSDCHHKIQLGKPSWSDFLHYISLQNIDFSDKRIIKEVYDTLGGNYRGAEYFISAVKKMPNHTEEENFLKELSTAKRDIQVNMAIEKILSFRSPQEIELLHRLSVYLVPVPKEGVRKISRDLPKDSIEILVSFSLVTKSTNDEYIVNEYQISPLVLDFIRKDIELSDELKVWASDYQVYLLEQERDTLHQAFIAHKALKFANRIAEADRLALDRITGELNRAGRYKTLLKDWLPDIAKSEDEKTRVDALYEIGSSHYSLADYRKALRYYKQSLKIAEEIEDKVIVSATLVHIGQIYQSRGDLDKALAYFQQSLKIAEEIEYKATVSAALSYIGLIYESRGDLDKALAYFEQSLKITEEIENKAIEERVLVYIGRIYKLRGDLDKALAYFEQSLKIVEEIGDKLGGGTVLASIGTIYQSRGDLDKALAYYEQSLKIAEEISNVAGSSYALLNIGTILLDKNNQQKAKEAWVKAYLIAKKIDLSEILDYLEN